MSGHIIHADACDCGDCDQYGGYQSIALVDVPGCAPWVLAHGGGDILDAALIYRDGGYVPAMTAHCEEGCREDIAGLLSPPAQYGAYALSNRQDVEHVSLVSDVHPCKFRVIDDVGSEFTGTYAEVIAWLDLGLCPRDWEA